MKKSNRQFWIVLILICIIGGYLSGPNSPFSNDNVEDLYFYKVINDVNLRDKPSSKSNIIDVLKQNELIVIVDSVNNWYNITDTNSNNGFVSKKYIKKTITNSNTSEIQPSINNKIILAIVCLGFVYFIFMRNRSKDDLKVKSVSSNKASIISKAKDPIKEKPLKSKPIKNISVSKGKPIRPLTDWPISSLQNYLNALREKGGDEKTIKFVKDLIKDKAKSLRNSKPKDQNKSKKSNVKKVTKDSSNVNTQKTIWMHLTHSKGTLFNDFEEGYEIPFFEGTDKGVEQRAQLHILYEIELPAGFDEDEDDVHNLIDWECIIAVKYIEGYLEQTNPDECFILGIDEDDYRNIESDNCYQWNGWGEDDSEVSKAKDVNEAHSIFGNYIAKFAKNKKDKYSPS